MNTTTICGIRFHCITMEETLNFIEDKANCTDGKYHIHTANVDHLVLIQKDKHFKDIINNSDLVTCDGMPIVWVSKLYKNSIPERVTGADITERILLESDIRGLRVFLLGAKPGVAARAAEKIRKRNPQAKIVGYYSPTNEELSNELKNQEIIKKINNSNANVLLVAFGSPKQEKWINKYRQNLFPNVTIGVGAAFDFIAEEIKRAPKFIREMGFEWLYRLLKEPRRLWKRYILNDSKFVIYVLLDLLRRRKYGE
ncbi:WecB/TagA/CpsF family glycosyltransferase [Anoxybacillus kestanbolensis]|uniref:WecB/TagA/CpsF family glycosyltransferase n=1 Tax=Anoxybacillus kestanbolensis TaxID=227476 RepID=UPI003D24CB9B